MDHIHTEQRGPYQFETPELAPGESKFYDFAQIEKSRYKLYLPFDSLQITNQNDTADVRVTINDHGAMNVPANSVEPLNDASVERVEIENLDASTTIPAGEVVVEVVRSAFDADDAARRDVQKGQTSRILERFTGIRL